MLFSCQRHQLPCHRTAGLKPSQAEGCPENGGPGGRQQRWGTRRSAVSLHCDSGGRAHEAVILLAPDLTVASATPAVGFFRLAMYLAVNTRSLRFCRFDRLNVRLGGAAHQVILHIL